jgi:hypothetical protein
LLAITGPLATMIAKSCMCVAGNASPSNAPGEVIEGAITVCAEDTAATSQANGASLFCAPAGVRILSPGHRSKSARMAIVRTAQTRVDAGKRLSESE